MPDDADIIKRLVTTLVWFYAGWYAGAMLAFLGGISPLLGPVIGVAAAGLYLGDTRGLWRLRRRTSPQLSSQVPHGLPGSVD